MDTVLCLCCADRRQVTWDCLHWNYIFISNFSYWIARQLASEIVAALSEQNVSQASYFKNILFRIKQLTIFFAAQEVYWFRVIHFCIAMQSDQNNCNSIVLLRSDFASTHIYHTAILIDSALHRCSCAAGCQHRFYKCMYAWINSAHCCPIDVCRMFDKISIFSAPHS